MTIDFSSKKVNESSNKSSSRPRNFTVKSNGLQEIQEFQNILTRLQVNTTGYSDEFLRDAWSRAQDLYYNRNGEKEHSGPVIFGLETCEEFRRKAGTNAQVGLAGLFNTGTNALNTNLQNNLGIPNNTINEHIKRGIYNRNGFWTEVPWWKHNVLTSEYRNRTTNKESWMPIVMVRDPLFWLHSTCKAPYNIKWVGQKPGGRSKDINLNGKCPNPGQEITYQMIFANPRKTVKYKGLIHLWNEFYQEYLKADFPRLIVRFEDAIFHLPQIVQHIQECVGAYSKHDSLQVQAGYAKRHGNTAGTSLLKVMLKALDKQARWESSKLTLEQRQDIRRTLDPELMKILHYKMPSDAAQFTTP